MKNRKVLEPDWDALLKKALKDDLPPEAEARMGWHFINLKRSLDPTEQPSEQRTWLLWMRPALRKEVLAFLSVFMLVLGGVLHLRGGQSALADSISRFKVLVDVSANLQSVTSMDCMVKSPASAGNGSSYHVRWVAGSLTRVDTESDNGIERTLWISDKSVLPDPVWQPAMEFLTPALLAQHMEKRYGLMQGGSRNAAEQDELLLVGREDGQVIEITLDESSYLPKKLTKYSQDSPRTGSQRQYLAEIQFLWNQPILRELFIPGSNGAKQRGNR